MPRRLMEQYYKQEEFEQMVKKLNALYSKMSPWRKTQARKKHEDLFGETIENGEVYFKREDGPAFDDVIKLSQLSMERLLLALFSGNYGLEESAQHVHEQREQELREAHARYSPIDNLKRRSTSEE